MGRPSPEGCLSLLFYLTTFDRLLMPPLQKDFLWPPRPDLITLLSGHPTISLLYYPITLLSHHPLSHYPTFFIALTVLWFCILCLLAYCLVLLLKCKLHENQDVAWLIRPLYSRHTVVCNKYLLTNSLQNERKPLEVGVGMLQIWQNHSILGGSLRTEVTFSSVVFLSCPPGSAHPEQHDKHLLVDGLNQSEQRGGLPGWSKGSNEIMGLEDRKRHRKLFSVQGRYYYCGRVGVSRFIVIFTVDKFKNMAHELTQESWRFHNFPLLWKDRKSVV